MAKNTTSSTKHRRPAHSLSHGRPPLAQNVRPSTLSSRTTRTTIRKHHNLHKSLARAQALGDTALAEQLTAQIEAEGGLKAYQAASLRGQSKERGGDTSKTLVGWLQDLQGAAWRGNKGDPDTLMPVKEGVAGPPKQKWKMLDIGALSTDTAAGRCGAFEIERIDLHSQAKGILEQDFMERPLPSSVGEDKKFDIVCLSLVVNYVPDAKVRGEMLRRARAFLVPPKVAPGPHHTNNSRAALLGGCGHQAPSGQSEHCFPDLFLVLPAPCVTNSRYLNEDHLLRIMSSLGFRLLKAKVTAKLAFSLWHWSGYIPPKVAFPKREIVLGKSRNNFAIVIE